MRIPSSSAKATGGGQKVSGGGGSAGKKAAVPTPCCSKVGLKRGPWTAEEDEVLSSYIRREGEGRWRTLPSRAGLLRCGKSCRLRWMNYLRPSVKRGHIAPDEEDLILRLHRLLGNRWSLIAGRIPGRTDNEIKNYWNTHLSKKLISRGIDPRTHKPLSSSSSSSSNPNSSISPPLHAPSSSSTPPSPIPDSPIGAFPLLPTTSTPPFFDASPEFNCGVLQDLVSPAGLGMTGFHRDFGQVYTCDISRGSADDAFSSFLNSLIHEDELATSQCQPQPEHHNDATEDDGLNTVSSSAQQALGPLLSGGRPVGCWEAPNVLSSSSAFNVDNGRQQHDPNPSISMG